MGKVTITCTDEQWSTIYTALRLELERNWGKDAGVVKLLKDAINVVSNREEVCK